MLSVVPNADRIHTVAASTVKAPKWTKTLPDSWAISRPILSVRINRETWGGGATVNPRDATESFTISSINEIGQEAFKALSAHSSSLKYLVLQSLQRPALTSLNILCHCRALEKFTLEASTIAEEFEWQSTVKQVFEHVVPWLSACADLRTLEMTKVPNATALLGEVLKSPDVRLTMLSVKLLESDETFFSSLGHQTQLRHLLIDAKYLLDVSDPRHTKLVDSICSCPELRELTLQNGPLERVDLQRICQRAPLLEDLTFEGEVTDEVLPVLAQLSHLKVLTVNGLSLFSFVGLHSFIQQLAMDEKASHANISISVADQTGAKLSEDEEALVQMEVARLFNGRFEVTDRQDPDELHQSDFSD